MLCLKEMKQIMDNVNAKHFLIQTNGLHLDKLEPEYTNRLHTILVSIDGNQALTDYYRGKGVYQRVVKNIQNIRSRGFQGEIIARMTVMEKTDIAKEIKWLLKNNDYSFSSIHWQLDAGFWKNDFTGRSFEKWVTESYNPAIQNLVGFWINHMEFNHEVLRLYPFLGIMQSLINGEKTYMRCGSGWINYSILTNGTIVPCPIMGGMKDFYLGHISYTSPAELKRMSISKPCTECEILRECGGRCLYANITRLWSDESFEMICNTVKNLISALKQKLPRVKQFIAQGKIKKTDFNYLKYNGCEIIP